MTMTDKERYEWAEKLLTFRNADGTLDQGRLREFAEAGEIKGTPDDLAAILNITQDLTANEQAESNEDSVGEGSVPSEESTPSN